MRRRPKSSRLHHRDTTIFGRRIKTKTKGKGRRRIGEEQTLWCSMLTKTRRSSRRMRTKASSVGCPSIHSLIRVKTSKVISMTSIKRPS